jgi:acyl carrier protein
MGLDTVELVMAVEEEFEIEIPNDVAMRLISVGAMQDYVVQTLQSRGTSANAAEIWKRLQAIIVFQLGVRPEEVIREAEFVRDLKAD